jgi:A/G-specific adenine glycosylase
MKELHDWFEANKRDFPWRKERTPYKVWVSEVMLQQTRASVVVPYFEKWLALFPDVASLANAPIESVIKTWEGLGYYSRARNLHSGAKQILERFSGNIPGTAEELRSIRGLGPYTVGAILSFGFSKRAAAVDGNVTRVLSRLFLIEENISKQATKRLIQEKAQEILDEQKPWVTAEALIELGASLCAPKPVCELCPLKVRCLAHHHQKAEQLPIKDEPEKTIELWRAVYLIEAEGKFLIKKGSAGKVMADLYEFPYLEMKGDKWSGRKKAEEFCSGLGMKTELVRHLPQVKHTFTKYRAHLVPYLLKADRLVEDKEYVWVEKDRLVEFPFSSGHRKILKEIV